jgi:hypothetical protein
MEWLRDLIQYLELKYEYFRLRTKQEILEIAASVVSTLVLGLVVLLIVLLVSLGLAFWIGELTGRLHSGFFAVALIYVLVAVLGIMNRSEINRWLMRQLVRAFSDHLQLDKIRNHLNATPEHEPRGELPPRNDQLIENPARGGRTEDHPQH